MIQLKLSCCSYLTTLTSLFFPDGTESSTYPCSIYVCAQLKSGLLAIIFRTFEYAPSAPIIKSASAFSTPPVFTLKTRDIAKRSKNVRSSHDYSSITHFKNVIFPFSKSASTSFLLKLICTFGYFSAAIDRM